MWNKVKLTNLSFVDNIFKQNSTSSTVPYFVRIAEFLTNVIPLICLMMKWYSVESTVAKSVDVEMKRHWIFISQRKIWIQIRLVIVILKLLFIIMERVVIIDE